MCAQASVHKIGCQHVHVHALTQQCARRTCSFLLGWEKTFMCGKASTAQAGNCSQSCVCARYILASTETGGLSVMVIHILFLHSLLNP